MKLSLGQKDFLLELLYGEYTCCPTNQYALRQAIARYATVNYSEAELDFLTQRPQSFSAMFYYSGANASLLQKHFMLWLNLLEYNLCDHRKETLFYCINPDPTGKEKLFRAIRKQDDVLFIPSKPLYFSKIPRDSLEITNDSSPLRSCFDLACCNELFQAFLNIANHTTLDLSAMQDLALSADYLKNESDYTQNYLCSWQELCQKTQKLFTIAPNYCFSAKENGLLLPSDIAFLAFLNTKKRHKSPVPITASPVPQLLPFSFFKRIKQATSFLSVQAPQHIKPKITKQHMFFAPAIFSQKSPVIAPPFPFRKPKHCTPHRNVCRYDHSAPSAIAKEHTTQKQTTETADVQTLQPIPLHQQTITEPCYPILFSDSEATL